MYKLFYSAGACSMAVHVVLNELEQNVALENVALSEGKNRTPEFLKVNPRGQVPVLVDGEAVIREGAAILIHLCEKHNSNLLPASGAARTEALQWLMFCNATLHPAYARAFFINRNTTDEAAKTQLLGVAATQINNLWKEVEEKLEKTPFLCGNDVTVADILLTVIANWNGYLASANIQLGANTKKLLQNVSSRPAYKKALEAENVQYKAAA